MPGGANWTLEIASCLLPGMGYVLVTVMLIYHLYQYFLKTRWFFLLWLHQAMRSLNYAWELSRREGKVFPYEPIPQISWKNNSLVFRFVFVIYPLNYLLRCWLQGDNACKEVKNSQTAKLGIGLVQGGFFSCFNQSSLQVGHTHEDVGLLYVVSTWSNLFENSVISQYWFRTQ